MRLADAVTAIYEGFPSKDSMGWIEKLSTLDRFQASKGIETAAEQVAEIAEQTGLSSVELRKYPADGERRWWSFRAPRSWTPIQAALEIEGQVVTSYPRDPCSIATYSAPTTPGGILAPLVEFSPGNGGQIRGAIAAISESPAPLVSMIDRLQEMGAIGFVTSTMASEEQVGRIELSLDSPLFGFSVTPSSIMRTIEASRREGKARATVRLDGRAAPMPIVTGVLPGDIDEEILVQAHLCHPRPGANDNLSGVAVLLGLVPILERLRADSSRRSIRFLWAPEFVGTAAFLYDAVQSGGRLPVSAINLDMVGEDQRKCGGPMIIERSPDHVGSFVEALVETAVEFLPEVGAGSVRSSAWSWRATPFAGTSDHALFADRAIARPAVQIGHWPDAFNHTSADTLDKVDPNELCRAAAVAGATALVAGDLQGADIGQLVARWGSKRLSDVAALLVSAPSSDSTMVDPHSSEHARGLLSHTERVVQDALRVAGTVGASGSIRGQAEALASLLPEAPSSRAAVEAAPTISRLWPGPFNLRGLIEDAPRTDAVWIRDQVALDRQRYVLMTAIALAIDGRSSFHEVIRRAAYSSHLPVQWELGERFIETLVTAGWAEKVPAHH